jgi:hypothetical protein
MESYHPYIMVKNGAPRVIRTPDLRIRSPSLYPAELWAQRQKTDNRKQITDNR